MLNYNPCFNTTSVRHSPIVPQRRALQNIQLPLELDYRKYGMVSSAKDQGRNCGCCWAFSTTAQY